MLTRSGRLSSRERISELVPPLTTCSPGVSMYSRTRRESSSGFFGGPEKRLTVCGVMMCAIETVVSSPGLPRYRSFATPSTRSITRGAESFSPHGPQRNSATSSQPQPKASVSPMPACVTPSLTITK